MPSTVFAAPGRSHAMMPELVGTTYAELFDYRGITGLPVKL